MLCKKIFYDGGFLEGIPQTRILLGIILEDKEDKEFILFKTTNKTHKIYKRTILSIAETEEEFKSEGEDDIHG